MPEAENAQLLTVLEQHKRLSESLLWRLQDTIFKNYGIEAWTKKGVPSYLTSNPFIAHQYVQLVCAYLRDLIRLGNFNTDETFYLFDLGAGNGRFSFLFIKQFLESIKKTDLEHVKICYVMCDIVPSLFSFWQRHPFLQSYIQNGQIDFASYHYNQKEPIELIQSKKTLSTVNNPIAVIANYFFDSMPQDLFRLKNGILEEGRITLKAIQNENFSNLTPDNPTLLDYLQYHWDYHPISNPENYYSSYPELNELLLYYQEKFKDAVFTLPIGGFIAIDFFEKLSKGQLLLLAGDQGYSSEKQIIEAKSPKIAKHGSFSLPVTYHLIAAYFNGKNGAGFLPEDTDPLFQVLCAAIGKGVRQNGELIQVFNDTFNYFAPNDYWQLASHAQNNWNTPSLDYLLLLLKLGRWDPMNLHAFYNAIREQIPTATPQQKERLRNALHYIWEMFFPISAEEGDFILNLGVLFFDLKLYVEALAFFKRSLDITGDKSITYTNMGACYLNLYNPEAAHQCFEKAQQLAHD